MSRSNTSIDTNGSTVLSPNISAFKPLSTSKNMQVINSHSVFMGNHKSILAEKDQRSIALENNNEMYKNFCNKSTSNVTAQLHSRNLENHEPSKEKTNSDAFNTQNISPHQTKQHFSHQHRRRPVYQRCNTDPPFSDNNHHSTSKLADMKNSSKTNAMVAFSSVGSASNPTSPVISYLNKNNFESLGCPTSLNGISTDNAVIRPSSCVYLRPEQNIPDVFVASRRSTTFKPIVESSKVDNSNTEKRIEEHLSNGSHCYMLQNNNLDRNGSNNNVCNEVQSRIDHDASISRDDIVVTMRSVNV